MGGATSTRGGGHVGGEGEEELAAGGGSGSGSGSGSHQQQLALGDKRRRNSLLHFTAQWADHLLQNERGGGRPVPGEGQESSQGLALLSEAARHWKSSAGEGEKQEAQDPVLAKMNRPPTLISTGDMRALRDAVIRRWKDINRSFQGSLGGDTVLHIVCREGYLPMLEFMLDPSSRSVFDKSELDMNALNHRQRSPLMLCFTPPPFTWQARRFGLAEEGGGEVLPRSERPAAASVDGDWVRPGGRRERERMVALLTRGGADPQALDLYGYTCLHYAAIWGWEDSLRSLLRAGASPDHVCATGESALHFAALYDRTEAAEALIQHSPELVNEADESGDRPIHVAIRAGSPAASVRFLSLLLSLGADGESPNYAGASPLHLACGLQFWQAVNVLLDAKVPREDGAFALLEGEAETRIRDRLRREDDEQRRLAKLSDDQAASEEQRKARRALGQWVTYKDKFSGKIFFYNKVSRKSQWEQPPDFAEDREAIIKAAVFGLSFYH